MSQFSLNNVMTRLIDWRNAQISSFPQGGIINCGKIAGTIAVTQAALTCLTTAAPILGVSNLSSALTCKVFCMIWPNVDSRFENLFECSAKDSFLACFRGMELCARNLMQRKVPTDFSFATAIIGGGVYLSPQNDLFLRFERDIADIVNHSIEKEMCSFAKEKYKELLRDAFPVDERFIDQSGETLVQEIINSLQISRFRSKEIREKLEVDHLEWKERNDRTSRTEWLFPERKTQLKERPSSVGFVYQLTTDARIVGYLIGTLHFLPTWMLAHKRILDALDRSGEFVSEVGDQLLTNELEFSRKLKKIVMMDAELTSEAKTRGVPIHALETKTEESTAIGKAFPFIYDRSLKDSDLKEIGEIEGNILNSGFISLLQNLWWQGNEEKLIDFTSSVGSVAYKILYSERNRKWTEGENGLIARLQRASSPLCIAVGATHLVRDDGLLVLFRNNGIQAEHLM